MLRRLVMAAISALGLVLSADVPVAGEVSPPAPFATRIDRRPPILVAVATSRPVVALTFDDGPDPRWTPRVLDELRRAGARATFFVTGDQARTHPDLLRSIVDGGHEVANHTDTHPHMDGLDAAAVASQVRTASMAIGAAGVAQAPYFRPPRGRYGTAAMTGVDETGLLPVGWTVCLERRLRHLDAEAGGEATAMEVRPGGILLAHDGGIPDRSATVAALPSLLRSLDTRGFEAVTLSELLPMGPPLHARPGVDPRAAGLTRVDRGN